MEGEADAGARSLGGRGRLTRMLALSETEDSGKCQNFNPCSGKPEEVQHFELAAAWSSQGNGLEHTINNQLEEQKEGVLPQQGRRR